MGCILPQCFKRKGKCKLNKGSLDSSVSSPTTSEFQASLNTKTKSEVRVCVDDDLQLILLGPDPPASAPRG